MRGFLFAQNLKVCYKFCMKKLVFDKSFIGKPLDLSNDISRTEGELYYYEDGGLEPKVVKHIPQDTFNDNIYYNHAMFEKMPALTCDLIELGVNLPRVYGVEVIKGVSVDIVMRCFQDITLTPELHDDFGRKVYWRSHLESIENIFLTGLRTENVSDNIYWHKGTSKILSVDIMPGFTKEAEISPEEDFLDYVGQLPFYLEHSKFPFFNPTGTPHACSVGESIECEKVVMQAVLEYMTRDEYDNL